MSSEPRDSCAPALLSSGIGLEGEAERCRSQALDFVGRPEHAFLLDMANAFDALKIERGVARNLASR